MSNAPHAATTSVSPIQVGTAFAGDGAIQTASAALARRLARTGTPADGLASIGTG